MPAAHRAAGIPVVLQAPHAAGPMPRGAEILPDVVRQLQNNLSQRHPLVYGVGEFTGAMTTPMHLVKDSTFTNKALNAVTDTLNASVGYAENWNDLATNLLVNGFANSIGLGVDMAPIGRGLGATGKKIIKQGVNYLTDKAKNILYNSKR